MKISICQTKLDDFNIERLEGYPFYERYDEILNAFDAHFGSKGLQFKSLFTKPVVNAATGIIDWYADILSDNSPIPLKEIEEKDKEQHKMYCELKSRIIKVLADTKIDDNTDKMLINCLTSHLNVEYIDEVVYCYDNKIIFGVWGMQMIEGRNPQSVITDAGKEHRIHKIQYVVKGKGKIKGPNSIVRRHGRVLRGNEDIPAIVPDEHYAFVQWLPKAPQGHKLIDDVTFTAVCERCDDYCINFISKEGGSFDRETVLYKKEGEFINEEETPVPIPYDDYHFKSWMPKDPSGIIVNDDMQFEAVFEKNPSFPPPPHKPNSFNIHFDAGENGVLEGASDLKMEQGCFIGKDEVPHVKPKKGYEFLGWDASPENWKVEGEKTFVAQYSAVIPWYKRIWLWLTGKGCIKWFLWLLLAIIFLLLFSWLLRSCFNVHDNSGCSRHSYGDGIPYPIDKKPWIDDIPIDQRHGIYNPGNPYNRVETPRDHQDILPPESGILPPIDTCNIIRDPNKQTVIGNLLNILMENDDKSIFDLARDFKAKYPEDKYQIVYYDDVVKRMQVKVPIEEKERLRTEIPEKFAPEYDLYVFDESLFVGGYIPNDEAFSDSEKSWYLNTVKAPMAWDETQGKETLTVAVVDNGFNLKHPEFKSKVVMPYNVWTHDKRIFAQDMDHGTHVAGTAIAVANNRLGLCGIAPKCAFMPIQVADQNGMMTTTSVLDGILYALYQGADVVNVSLGMEFVSGMPEDVQRELQNNYFKEEELLWKEVMKIADKHNAVVVVAAGNENILAGVNPLNRPRNFIIVSAVDKKGNAYRKAGFSNHGDYSTVSAPGVGIYSSYGVNGFEVMDGTSMAAPIVSGAVALMKSIDESLKAEQIICVLKGTGIPINDKIGNLIQIDKALAKVKAGELEDCQGRPETPSTGDVQILMSWNDYNDLDLACVDPNGDIVWYKNKRIPSGGCLEIDMNVEYGDSKTPIENIFWPTGQAPFGTYTVFGSMYKQHEPRIASSPFHLKVIFGDSIKEYEGVLSKLDGREPLCSFTLGNVLDDGNDDNGHNDSGGLNQNDGRNSNSRRDELLRQRDILQRQLDEIDNELKEFRNN